MQKNIFPEDDIILFEDEIKHEDVNKLEKILSTDSENIPTLIFRNIEGGSWDNAMEMREIIHHLNFPITVICDGEINISGLLPIISVKNMDRIATANTKFILDAKHYIDNYVDIEKQIEANMKLRIILYNHTRLTAVEIMYMLSKSTVINAYDACKFGLVDDIFIPSVNKDIYDSFNLNTIKMNSYITIEKRFRDELKCEGKGQFILNSLN